MNKIQKITTSLILIYSVLLLSLGVYVFWSYSTLNFSFLEGIFTEFVDLDIWLLNWQIIAYLCISSGLLGLYLGILIWKRIEGADRLWLLFAAWLIAINSIQIGQYRFGEPEILSIAIIACLFLISWFSYRNKKIGALTIIREKPFAEIFVFFIVATQLSGIILVGAIEDPNKAPLTEKEIETLVADNVEEYFTGQLKLGMLGKHPQEFEHFFDFYERKDTEKLKKIGEFLLKDGYQNDKFILMTLGSVHYAEGDLPKAAAYLERATKGEHTTELLKSSSERMLQFEDSQILYMLSRVYAEQGYAEKAEVQYKKSHELFRKSRSGEDYQKYIAKFEDLSKNVLNHFKDEQQ